MGISKNLFLLSLALVCSSPSLRADEIEFPEEELARESTLPIFDKQRAVLNRNVITEKRFEFGIGGGLEMNEPYYNDYMFSGQGTYNYSDTSAFNIQGLFWLDGLSDYGEQLKTGTPTLAPGTPGYFESFDASKAPHPVWAVFANYQFIAYYGKISVSKQTVMNLNLFALAGLGYINMDSISTVGFNLGVGQNFFITNNVGIRADLRWLIFQGPNAPSQRLRPTDQPSPSSFEDRIYYNGQLGLALVFLL
jgi:outer membrane beta-barrel protein